MENLMKEKKDILDTLAGSQTELEKQRESVRDVISVLEHQMQCSTIEMLQVRLQVHYLRVRTPENRFPPSVLL